MLLQPTTAIAPAAPKRRLYGWAGRSGALCRAPCCHGGRAKRSNVSPAKTCRVLTFSGVDWIVHNVLCAGGGATGSVNEFCHASLATLFGRCRFGHGGCVRRAQRPGGAQRSPRRAGADPGGVKSRGVHHASRRYPANTGPPRGASEPLHISPARGPPLRGKTACAAV